jgi:deoxyribose-phosphate aldolase
MVGIEIETIRAPRDLARLIDHTLLDPSAGLAEVARACDEAKEYRFAGVCVRGAWVSEVARRLAGSSILPVAVVDFPLGEGSTAVRALEARNAVVCGAEEIDLVLPVEPLKRKDYRYVLEDLVEVVGRARVPVKVILETCRLTLPEKTIACALAKSAGAAFVKTSTGMGSHGATAEDVALMRSIVGEEMGVKASGGIRTTAAAMRMVEAGANRLGTSASVAIVSGVS